MRNRSKVAGESMRRLRRIEHELHNQLLKPINELGGQSLVRLRIHHHNPFTYCSAVVVLLLLHLHRLHCSLSDPSSLSVLLSSSVSKLKRKPGVTYKLLMQWLLTFRSLPYPFFLFVFLVNKRAQESIKVEALTLYFEHV